jgi:DNA repair exonuclease SbcCD ATPase subunit
MTVERRLNRLSADYARAMQALDTWAEADCDTMKVCLCHISVSHTCTDHTRYEKEPVHAARTTFSHLTHILSTLASTEDTIRTSMKDLRTRGEALEDLRRRRRALTTQVSYTERRLSKMAPDHPNFATQQAALSELKKDIRDLNEQIAEGEVNCSKLKKASAEQWMTNRFGGIYSLAERSQVGISLALIRGVLKS